MINTAELKKKLGAFCSSDNITENCPMADHTSFKCGGNAALLAVPSSYEKLAEMLAFFENESVPHLFIGNGSNMIFSDAGYDGVVVKAPESADDIVIEGNTVTAFASAPLIKLSRLCCQSGLTGLEFASGIPGSVGGAVFMNAGAYGGEMKDVIVSVRSAAKDGRIVERSVSELDLGYRTSVFQKNGEFIISATLKLAGGDQAQINDRVKELTAARTLKQPLSYPSAGSFFKRPEGYFAGKLIEDAGLKGLSIGGAQISELHAGFMINAGGAAASDVIDLMRVVQETVLDRFGVLLEPEVRIIGEY